MVVTNRFFTQAARKLARANGVVLWDRDRLVKALLAVRNS
jgi:HJR/Mrr/RecB family endonuclease